MYFGCYEPNYIRDHRNIHLFIYYLDVRVDEVLNVKISDNALSRDFFPGDYHCLGDNENRPVRWMAAECLECSEYSPASDVVSFFFIIFVLFFLRTVVYLCLIKY